MAGKKILLVDDDPEILDILEKKLKQKNYDCIAVSDGKKAIRKCKILNPDLIILDIVMPDIDGYTVANTLREDKSLENTPIIFMSAKELEYSGVEKRLLEIGHCDFITKPCIFEDLLLKIEEKIG